jgi:hypothetical protein
MGTEDAFLLRAMRLEQFYRLSYEFPAHYRLKLDMPQGRKHLVRHPHGVQKEL